MGFTMLVCGFGVFTLAVLHLIAHSCYKAHAFLSASSAVDVARASRVPGPGPARPGASVVLAPLLALGTVAAVARLVGVSIGERPADVALAGILALGLAQLLGQSVFSQPSVRGAALAVLAAAGITLSFFALELAGLRVFAGVVPVVRHADPGTLWLIVAVTVLFGLISVGQLLLPTYYRSAGWAHAYLLMRNGFYANACFDRCVGALRVHSGTVPLKGTR